MGATYTRQSSATIVDGATIEAAHFNLEFDALLAAFAASTGHTHDGTAAEGGPITKLLGNTLTFGAGAAGTDISITFDGETSDGVLKWMEDEDYFEFSDDILIASTEKIQFRDTAIFINSSTDGQLDLVADTEIQIAATTVDINGNVDISGTLTVAGALDFGDANITNVGSLALDSITSDGSTITLDSSGDIILDAGGEDITLKDDGTTFGSLTNSSGELVIKSGSTPTAAITLSGANTTIEGNLTVDGNFDVTGTLDFSDSSITNIGSIALDTITNDGTDITLDSSGDIILDADGGDFNFKDDGTEILRITNSSSDVIIRPVVDAKDLIFQQRDGTEVARIEDNGTFNVVTDKLAINGTAITSTAAELNILDGVTSTATELNIMDGDTSASSTTLADADRLVTNDAGTMKQVALTDLKTYLTSAGFSTEDPTALAIALG